MASPSSTVFFGLSTHELRQGGHANDQQHFQGSPPAVQTPAASAAPPERRRRNQAGNPSPESEVVALSPETLMATNRFVCEVCNKGFQREQNLQLHKRGHNLPWKLKQKTGKEIPRRKVYLCPEPGCVHHDPSRALGDLTGIKKHYFRKHGEKKYKCDKCTKMYAVQSDWKAHSRTCGTREYKCECGTPFSRRDSYVSHRTFCDALAKENAKQEAAAPASFSIIGNHLNGSNNNLMSLGSSSQQTPSQFAQDNNIRNQPPTFTSLLAGQTIHPLLTCPAPLFYSTLSQPEMEEDNKEFIHEPINTSSGGSTIFSGLSFLPGSGENNNYHSRLFGDLNSSTLFSSLHESPTYSSSVSMSATALLQKAAQLGSTSSNENSPLLKSFGSYDTANKSRLFGGFTSGVPTTRCDDHLFYSVSTTGGSGLASGENEIEDGYGGYNGKSNEMNSYFPKMHPGLGFGNVNVGVAGGAERSILTRDFLGMGIVRSMSGGPDEVEMRFDEKPAPEEYFDYGGDAKFHK